MPAGRPVRQPEVLHEAVMSRNSPSAGGRGPRGDPALAQRLAREIEGEVLFDRASRGRYATDASIYQIEPLGVAIPRTEADVARIVEVAAESGTPLLARGAERRSADRRWEKRWSSTSAGT